MCGRFVLYSPARSVAERFGLQETPELAPRRNIAPTQMVAIVRNAKDAVERELKMVKWGLVPSWAKDAKIGSRLINARSETVPEKPAFRAAFKSRRCLVPADGFYEWMKVGSGKQPYFIRMADEGLFAFAGLWERWKGPDETVLESVALLTTEANELVGRIHDRMPVILPEPSHNLWLDTSVKKPEELTPLLRPFPADLMISYPVSLRVNKPDNDDADLIKPI